MSEGTIKLAELVLAAYKSMFSYNMSWELCLKFNYMLIINILENFPHFFDGFIFPICEFQYEFSKIYFLFISLHPLLNSSYTAGVS